jgi:hypothetical protein
MAVNVGRYLLSLSLSFHRFGGGVFRKRTLLEVNGQKRRSQSLGEHEGFGAGALRFFSMPWSSVGGAMAQGQRRQRRQGKPPGRRWREFS